MGLEAARHFVRLHAAKVVLAVRSVEKGLKAAADIAKSTDRVGVVEVWELDLEKYDSVKAFAARVMGLERVDVLVANAAVFMFEWSVAKGTESELTMVVNVVSQFLLAMMVSFKLSGYRDGGWGLTDFVATDLAEDEGDGGQDGECREGCVHWIVYALDDQISREEGGEYSGRVG